MRYSVTTDETVEYVEAPNIAGVLDYLVESTPLFKIQKIVIEPATDQAIQPGTFRHYPFTRDDFETEDDWCRAKDDHDADDKR